MDDTPSQTVGPYLSLGLPWQDGPVADPDGVRLAGRVLDGAGEPIVDALVEAWHHDPPAFARCPTDDDGRWHIVVPPPPPPPPPRLPPGPPPPPPPPPHLDAPAGHPALAQVPLTSS